MDLPEIPVRAMFEKNVAFVDKFLVGKGLDMGCGNCPLLKPSCKHVDISPQPLAVVQVGEENVIHGDASVYWQKEKVDYVFSSHMLEDLGGREQIIFCLKNWSRLLKSNGYIVLLLPDMQGGRYPKVEEEGNPSHRVNVGVPFFREIEEEIGFYAGLEIVQMDTIPHDQDCTLDVVLRYKK